MQIDYLKIIIKEKKNLYDNIYDYSLELIVGFVAIFLFFTIKYGFDWVIFYVCGGVIILAFSLVIFGCYLNNRERYFKINTENNRLIIKKFKERMYRLDDVTFETKILVDNNQTFYYKMSIYNDGRKVYTICNDAMESEYFRSREFLNLLTQHVNLVIVEPKKKPK